jgi:uncharacterized protein with LGFP repeats
LGLILRKLLAVLSATVAASAALIVVPVVTVPVTNGAASTPHPVVPVLSQIAMPVASGAHTASGHAAGASVVPASFARTAAQPVAEIPAQDTKPFRLVGLTWTHDPAITALTAQVRVRSDGAWTGWQDLEKNDSGPDAGTPDARRAPRDATEPLWVGDADGVEARVVAVTGPAPRDVRVDLIDPGTSAADAHAGHTAAPLNVASAAVAQPAIITRAQWGADPSLRLRACPSGPEYTGAPKVAFVHHTVTGNSYGPGDSAAIVRSIYAYHVEGEGWCDVGYNFLVDQYGQVFEGRYGGITKPVLGAHTGGFNTDSFGVSMIGTYDTVTPSAALQASLARLIAWRLSLSYANPLGRTTLTAATFSGSRYPTGTKVAFNVISGHRDADLTACPGNAGYAILPGLRQAVAQLMVAGLVTPSATVTPRTKAANGSVRVTAGMLAAGDWKLLVQDGSGNTLKTLTGNGASVDTTWDMTDQNGNPVAPGTYQLTLSSTQNGATAVPWSAPVTVGGPFDRLSGPDRYATAVAVGDTAAANATTVVIASGQSAPDAVAAGPLAVHLSAPLLLTTPTSLPPSVAADIRRRHATTAYVVGGPVAIGPAVEDQLRSLGVTTVTRLGGADRFSTAALVAAQVGASGGQAFVVEGNAGLTDGFTIGGIAGALGRPILMATSSGVPDVTSSALSSLGVTSTTVVGGRVPASVVSTLPGGTQIAGADRYATSVAVVKALGNQVPAGALLLANGAASFPADALTAAALGRPTLRVTPTRIPASEGAWLASSSGIATVTAIGGPAAISDAVASSAAGLARVG